MEPIRLSQNLKEVIKPIETLLYENDTISDALKKLQEKHLDPKIAYFYVIDEEKRLKGTISTRKLLLSPSNLKLREIMNTSVIKLNENQTLKDSMESFANHNLLAFPVTDNENRLLGVIDVDLYTEESFDIFDAKRRADIFQLIGLSLEEEKKNSAWKNYTLRMPWIFCSIVGGLICAIISRMNEIVLSKTLVLVMFIPLVLSLSESTSIQSMTHTIQDIKKSVSWKNMFKKAIKECQLVSLIATSSGLIVGLFSLLWKEGAIPSLIIGLGITLSVSISSIFGLFFPVILHKMKLDPKIASGPVVLALADILTTTLYLWLATRWIL